MDKEQIEAILTNYLDATLVEYQQTADELYVKLLVSDETYEYRVTKDLLLDRGIYIEALDMGKQFENEVKYLQRAMERGIGSDVYMPFLKRTEWGG